MNIDSPLQPKDQPAPPPREAGFRRLCLALVAPPVAWSTQSIVGYGIASRACYPRDVPRATPVFPALRGVVLGLNCAALMVCAVCLLIAYQGWSAARCSPVDGSRHVIEGAPSRIRFLSICAMLIATGFLAATAFTSMAVLFSPLCR